MEISATIKGDAIALYGLQLSELETRQIQIGIEVWAEHLLAYKSGIAPPPPYPPKIIAMARKLILTSTNDSLREFERKNHRKAKSLAELNAWLRSVRGPPDPLWCSNT